MKILFRQDQTNKDEAEVAAKYFDVVNTRADLPGGGLIIPRYSSLPYYNELEADCNKFKCNLINSYEQHKWIANFSWYSDLQKYTFDTWDSSNLHRAPTDIAYVVKGKTNSRKWQWNTHMYAKNRYDAVKIGCDLYSDGLIGTQGIIYRRYEKLKTFEVGVNGLPFTNEYRFFVLGDTIIASGYYWSVADNIDRKVPKEATKLANEIIKVAKRHTNFYVLDIAQREDDTWVLVEVNCGTMSGLTTIDPDVFYASLKEALVKK